MTAAALLAFLEVADDAFDLGGRLLAFAHATAPELNRTPLPELDRVERARADALARGALLASLSDEERIDVIRGAPEEWLREDLARRFAARVVP